MMDFSFLHQVQKIILQAGKYVQQEIKNFDLTRIQYKNNLDLVSYVDIQTEQFLIQKLSKLFPDAGFIAEESNHHTCKEWNFIIDPLDGTTNFTRHLPSYAISVALAHHQQVQAGWVYNIPCQEFFYAVKNQGAYLNHQKICVSNHKTMNQALIATGFSVSMFDKVEAQLHIIKEIIPQSLGIRRMGAASVDLCYVAAGRFDGFFEWYLNPWDVAAGSLIAQEAGAIVSDFSGQNNFLFNKEIIAAQPNIYEHLLQIIQKYTA